ncbi:hypothetical protein FRC00_013320 [Tulasnella sp. 408]|nr:hypothetical protein FRC00_013320 [Tulasnella sp. 408]
MAVRGSSVTTVPHRSKTPAPRAPPISNPTSAPRSQPRAQRTRDPLDQVQTPTPPVDDAVTTPPPTQLTPAPTNKPHVQSGAAFVERIHGAKEGVQDTMSFACGLFSVWPLEKLVRFFGGKATEGAVVPPRTQTKQPKNDTEDDGPQGQQEEDAMGNKAPPPYPQSWAQDSDGKEAQKHLNDRPA